MHYQRGDVILAFHLANESVLHPVEADLESADQSLFDDFDALLRKEAPKAGIDPNPLNLSRLAVLAALSSGSSNGTMVRRACEYFKAVDGASSLPSGPGAVTEIVIGGAAEVTRATRKATTKRAPAKTRAGRKRG
ncbi:MAG: hypothetical protein ACREMA_06235 [Longimicrobiales bacterium]